MDAVTKVYGLLGSTFCDWLDGGALAASVSSQQLFYSDLDVFAAIETASRLGSGGGLISGGAGRSAGLYPFLTSVLDSGSLEHAKSRMEHLDGARGPHALSPDLAAEGSPPSVTPTRLPSGGRGPGRGSSPRPRGSSPRSSALSFGSGVGSIKDVLNEYDARNLVSRHLAIHEQLIAFFSGATALVRGSTPSLSLGDGDALFAHSVIEAIVGQCAILHTVRATLKVLSSDSSEASLLLESLSTELLASTVLDAIEEDFARSGGRPSELDAAVAFICFGSVAARMLAPLLRARSPPIESSLLAAVQACSFTGGGGRLKIDLLELSVALGRITSFGDGAHTATKALIKKVTAAREINFTALTPDGETVNWSHVVDREVHAASEWMHGRRLATGDDLIGLVRRLKRTAVLAAKVSDSLTKASGMGLAERVGVFAVSDVGDDLDPGPDWFSAQVYWLGVGSERQKCTSCPAQLPKGARICTECEKFQVVMFRCPTCRFPVPMGQDCRIYFCSGSWEDAKIRATNGAPPAMTPAELQPLAKAWITKHRAAVAKRQSARGAAAGSGGYK